MFSLINFDLCGLRISTDGWEKGYCSLHTGHVLEAVSKTIIIYHVKHSVTINDWKKQSLVQNEQCRR